MAIGFNIGGSVGVVAPDKTLSKTVTPRVQLAQFGDGYEQRLSTGINPIAEVYTVSIINRTRAVADDIIAFFEGKKGATNFDFILPDNSTGASSPFEKTIKVVCDDWSLTYENALASSVSATFRRVYEP